MKNQYKKNLTPIFIILAWGIYGLIYFYLKKLYTNYNFDGWTSFFITVIVTYIGIHYSLTIWLKSSNKKTRQLFGLFALSIIYGFIANVIYQTLFNVLDVPKDSLSIMVLSSYNIPHISLIMLQSLVWLMLLQKIKLGKSNFIPLYLIVITAALCFSFALSFHSSSRNIMPFDWDGSYNLIELFLEITGFLSALICFIFAKNRGIFYLTLSFLLIMGTDIAINFGFFSKTFGASGMIETGWVLGVFFRIYGLYVINKTKLYKTLPETWVYNKINA